MVYKKYIKRKVNGETRLFGPYYYESYRDKSGKVKTRYIAGPEDNYLGAKDTEKNHSGKRKKAFKIVLMVSYG